MFMPQMCPLIRDHARLHMWTLSSVANATHATQVYPGTVERIAPFGAFVKILGFPKDGEFRASLCTRASAGSSNQLCFSLQSVVFHVLFRVLSRISHVEHLRYFTLTHALILPLTHTSLVF